MGVVRGQICKRISGASGSGASNFVNDGTDCTTGTRLVEDTGSRAGERGAKRERHGMSNTQHEMAQALAEKSWIEDRLNEVRVRNKQGIPLTIGDIETLLMMALDQGRALQRGFNDM